MQSKRYGSYLPLLLLGALIICSFDGLPFAKAELGPVRLWPKKGAYAWQAAVDREAGIATSKESANTPTRSRLYKSLNCTDDGDLLPYAQKLFSPYPTWLVSFPVTFGLLKAVPNDSGGFEIRDRIFGANWLTFGQTQGQRVSFKSNTVNGPTQTSQCTVSLPITGGLLALVPPEKPNSRNRGAVLFTLTKRKETGSSSSSSDSDHSPQTVCSITTAVAGYRPFLVGSAPCNVLRQGLYFGTQSLVHASVMWRFHRRCWGMSTDKVFPTKSSKK